MGLVMSTEMVGHGPGRSGLLRARPSAADEAHVRVLAVSPRATARDGLQPLDVHAFQRRPGLQRLPSEGERQARREAEPGDDGRARSRRGGDAHGAQAGIAAPWNGRRTVGGPARVERMKRAQPLPNRGAPLRAGVPLVELVLPRRTPERPSGSHHQPPRLLAAVGKAASHANQTTLCLTPLHGRADVPKRLIANIGAALQHVRAAAEQFQAMDPWGCMLRYTSDRVAPVTGPPRPPPRLAAAGELPDSG